MKGRHLTIVIKLGTHGQGVTLRILLMLPISRFKLNCE